MPKLSALVAETGTAQVKIGGQTVKLVYRQLWRSNLEDIDLEEAKQLPAREYYGQILPRLLVKWDLQGDSGEEIPITAEAIAENAIPTDFLRLVELAVLEAGELGKARNGSSPGS